MLRVDSYTCVSDTRGLTTDCSAPGVVPGSGEYMRNLVLLAALVGAPTAQAMDLDPRIEVGANAGVLVIDDLDLINTRLTQLQSVVDLYEALGGGWQ